jgi:copper chaperone CopZ
MTCEHCVRAVSGELGALSGVSGVTVDLIPGGASAVTVTSDGPLAWRAVADVLDEAGDYQLAGSRAGRRAAMPGRRSSLGPGVTPGPFGPKVFSRTGRAARDSVRKGAMRG